MIVVMYSEVVVVVLFLSQDNDSEDTGTHLRI